MKRFPSFANSFGVQLVASHPLQSSFSLLPTFLERLLFLVILLLGEAHFLAVSAKDDVYVADTLNWRVQKFVRKAP